MMTFRERVWCACALTTVAACVPSVKGVGADIDAMLSRGGGFTGLSETVHVWSTAGVSQAIYARSDRAGSKPVQLPKRTLDSTLVVIESLISRVPRIPPDTGTRRIVCADVILSHIDVRRAGRIESAQEECPHRTQESALYWQRVDSLFTLLKKAASPPTIF